MCRYRKTLFLCNHSALSSAPQIPCATHLAHTSSPLTSPPCTTASTHACSTVRVSRLCGSCSDKKQSTDRRLSEVKVRIAGLRDRLSEVYGDCARHLDEVGVEVEGVHGKSGSEGGSEGMKEEEEDPVQAFLRKKRAEKDSHLMMLGS